MYVNDALNVRAHHCNLSYLPHLFNVAENSCAEPLQVTGYVGVMRFAANLQIPQFNLAVYQL